MHFDKNTFASEGYLLIPKAIPEAPCREFGRIAVNEYERLVRDGWRFVDSGALAGHLNIRMGEPGRALLAELERAGIPALIAELAGEPVHLAQAHGNLNLSGSVPQDYHMDGEYERAILIANICLVPTDNTNGATALVPRSNAEKLSYWQFRRGGGAARAIRPALQPGDVLIRPSNLWHRGTANPGAAPRPMAAFSYLPESLGGQAGPVGDLDGPLTIHGNKYYGRFKRLKEFAAVRLPRIDEALRLGRSLAQDLRRRA